MEISRLGPSSIMHREIYNYMLIINVRCGCQQNAAGDAAAAGDADDGNDAAVSRLMNLLKSIVHLFCFFFCYLF